MRGCRWRRWGWSDRLRRRPKCLTATVGRALKISPRHFTNRSRELFDESPAKLLLQLKMRRAEEMLRYSVMRVSDALGFVNPFRFSRVYQRFHDHAPSQRPQAVGRGVKQNGRG